MDHKIKILIIDDSAFMRKLISDFFSLDSRFEVVATARDGKDGLVKLEKYKPDVITLDVEMPVQDGITTLKEIMRNRPTPVIMVSMKTTKGAEATILALENGAVDFVTKPSGAISLDLHKVKDDILQKCITASQANLLPVKYDNRTINALEKAPTNNLNKPTKNIVCIGTSTGGPKALQKVLSNIPKDICSPILIVQHMPPGFTQSLANRLNQLTKINVKEAEDDEILCDGFAYIAPGGYHMEVVPVKHGQLKIRLDDSPPVRGHKPAVDSLFLSVAQLQSINKVAVVMTGMGTDGAMGVKSLKEYPFTHIIAESQDSAIIYGMPKSAIETNKVDHIVHLDEIAKSILLEIS
jgi:two-component system, chemotaxis family, protein-glutamate methylesterase/glutaminase